MLDEYLDIRCRIDHLRDIMYGHTSITEIFSNFAHDVSKLLHVVLHEVDLGIIVFLNTIKSIAILRPDLVHESVD